MTLEQLVTDLATSQQLKDAGFPQDTALVWFIYGESVQLLQREQVETFEKPNDKGIAAPTAEEILKELPPYLPGSCCQLDLDVMHFSGCNFDGTPALLKWIVQWCCPEIDEVVCAQESHGALVLAAALAFLW